MSKAIDIKLGYTCNSDCQFCACIFDKIDLEHQSKPIDLTTEEVKQLLISYTDQYDTCILTGGEPTIRKDFLEILQLASSLYRDVCIQTNGRKISQSIAKFCQSNNIRLSINIPSGIEEIYTKIVRNKHAFSDLKRSLSLLSPDLITIICIVTKDNVQTLSSIVDFAISFEIKSIAFLPLIATKDQYVDHYQYIANLTDTNQALLNCKKLCKQYGILFKLGCGGFPLCILDKNMWLDILALSQDQTIQSIPVNQSTFIADVERRYVNRHYIPGICNACFLQTICEGPVNGYEDQYGISEFKPIYLNLKPISRQSKNLAQLIEAIQYAVDIKNN